MTATVAHPERVAEKLRKDANYPRGLMFPDGAEYLARRDLLREAADFIEGQAALIRQLDERLTPEPPGDRGWDRMGHAFPGCIDGADLIDVQLADGSAVYGVEVWSRNWSDALRWRHHWHNDPSNGKASA